MAPVVARVRLGQPVLLARPVSLAPLVPPELLELRALRVLQVSPARLGQRG